MSQAGDLSAIAGPVPPIVATSYVTDVNSPAVPAANVLNVIGGSTTVNDNEGIQTDGSSGSNTLTVQLTNRLTGTSTAVGAATSDIITFNLGASSAVYRFSFLVAGRSTAGASVGSGIGYTVDASAKTDGATATIIATPDIDADEDSALTAALMSCVASGNTVILRATGVAGETISYRSVATYVVI